MFISCDIVIEQKINATRIYFGKEEEHGWNPGDHQVCPSCVMMFAAVLVKEFSHVSQMYTKPQSVLQGPWSLREAKKTRITYYRTRC